MLRNNFIIYFPLKFYNSNCIYKKKKKKKELQLNVTRKSNLNLNIEYTLLPLKALS